MEKRDDIQMIDVPGGTFRSGIRAGAPDDRITLPDFRLAQTQTSNREFALFCTDRGRGMGQHTPAWGLSDDAPVVNVTWYEAVEYTNWLSDRAGLGRAYLVDEAHPDPDNHNKFDQVKWTVSVDRISDGFRLPTEAEWEYAARAAGHGREFRFVGGDDLEQVGWFAENSQGRTHDRAQKKPNELEFYDMSGNASEWCWDWFKEPPAGLDDNPWGPREGTYRVVRGGSWNDSDDECLLENRNFANPHVRHHTYGLRLARNT